MSSHISSAGVSKKKHKPITTGKNRSKPSIPVVSTSNTDNNNNNHHMLKINLNTISKLEVINLKRKLTTELNEVRSLINRFDGKNKKLKNDKATAQIFRNCINLLTKLMKHKVGWVFNIPVDAKGLGLTDYHTIVKQPMDLGTVKVKLGKSLYNSPLDFAEDVRLTFNNAILYNPIGHEVHHMAKLLLSVFEEKWIPIEVAYDNLHRKFKPTPVLEPIPSPSPRRVEAEAIVEKPEVEEEVTVSERDLTLDEKRSLSEDLQDLPFDKLEIVVEIIRKSNPDLSQQDDEIELDIESIDIKTLWELYRFVTEYKESLSKKKEEEEHGIGSERDAESFHNTIQEPATLANDMERSSSDSGSCSSDSDSDSSSGHGSDTGH